MIQPIKYNLEIPVNLKILVALHFLVQGSYQKCIGQDYFAPMSQSSVSRSNEVTATIVTALNHLIKFPTTEEEKIELKQEFMDMPNDFPGIIGCIDGTHVAIVSTPVDDDNFPAIAFLNRKGFYSLNVQLICSAKLKILGVNAKFPGSVHDAGIWTTSTIKRELTEKYNAGDHSSWLLGDSGYPLEPWLMTPVLGRQLNISERRYNIAHKSMRNVIERLNGILKGRFRALLKYRVLHYSPPKAATIVNAAAILHNFSLERHDFLLLDNEITDENFEEIVEIDNNFLRLNNNGRATRDRLIRNYFTNKILIVLELEVC